MQQKRNTFLVLGGGAVGRLIAARLPEAVVLEQQHKAQYTLLADRGAHYLWHRVPCVKTAPMRVYTYVDTHYPDTGRVVAYKRKVGKLADVDTRDKLNEVMRTQFCPERVGFRVLRWPDGDIRFGQMVAKIDAKKRVVTTYDSVLCKTRRWRYDTLVSTIPLPALAQAVGEDVPLSFTPLHAHTTQRESTRGKDILCMNYIADPSTPLYRMTMHGRNMLCESLVSMEGGFNIWPGKIHRTPESEALVLRMFEEYNVRLFGRFGAWAPDELMHETWERIDQWASAGAM